MFLLARDELMRQTPLWAASDLATGRRRYAACGLASGGSHGQQPELGLDGQGQDAEAAEQQIAAAGALQLQRHGPLGGHVVHRRWPLTAAAGDIKWNQPGTFAHRFRYRYRPPPAAALRIS